MKKFIAFTLAVLLCLGATVTAAADELGTCTVFVDSAAAIAGDTITVAIRISDNPGFTNFAIGLNYDKSSLELKSLNTIDCLCGNYVSSNLQRDDEHAYVVAASETAVKEDGILFAATFLVKEDVTETMEIQPEVFYIRNNEATFTIFEQLRADEISGSVSLIQIGDVNCDGMVEYDDVVLAYRAYLGEAKLNVEQMAVVDRNGNGTVEEAEYQAIYQVYIGG